jgi:hypothetical protein
LLRPARRLADPRQTVLANEPIQESGLADVGSSGKSDLRILPARQLCRVGDARQKAGFMWHFRIFDF